LPNLITKITSRSCKTVISFAETSCARGDTICLRPSSPCGGPSASCRRGEQVQRSSSSFPRRTRSHGPTRTAASALRVKAALSKGPGDLDLESGVRVTSDVGYLCANFGLLRPLCSPVRPDVRERCQTSDAHHRLLPPPYWDRGIIIEN